MTYLLRRVKHYAHETGPEDERDGPARHVRPSFLALGLRADLLHDWLAFVEGRSFDSPSSSYEVEWLRCIGFASDCGSREQEQDWSASR